jgi:hypothetical protein
MKPGNPSSAAVVPATTATSTLAFASRGIAERLKCLAERPQSLCVCDLIDRCMALYAGRDSATVYRLTCAWQWIGAANSGYAARRARLLRRQLRSEEMMRSEIGRKRNS